MDLIFLQQAQTSGNISWVMLIAMFVVFYFFLIRPQVKKNKQQQQFREGVKKGDKIVTTGGIHGKIAEIRDKVFIIDTEGGGRLKIEKTAVSMEASAALNGGAEAPAKK